MTYHENKLPAVFLFLKHSLMDENHLRKKKNKLREKENKEALNKFIIYLYRTEFDK